jgi:hypothetical protein
MSVMATQYADQSSLRAERQQLRSKPKWTFVDPYRFQALAVSARRLLRADEPAAGLRGLLDPETGTHFVTEEEKLFSV